MESFAALNGDLTGWEAEQGVAVADEKANRLFYFAIPPNVFLDVARCIKAAAVSPTGWTRIVVEKPFGHDYDTCEKASGLGG